MGIKIESRWALVGLDGELAEGKREMIWGRIYFQGRDGRTC